MTATKRKVPETSNTTIRVAYKGTPFSFTYNASRRFFQKYIGEQNAMLDHQTQTTLKDVFEKVQNGECDYGVVPVESSSFGSINGVYERLVGSRGAVRIIGEIGVVEYFSLCVPDSDKTSKDTDIAEIVSNPHIFECCGDYLDRLDAKRVSLSLPKIVRTASWDTAAACESVAQEAKSSDHVTAAICSREAAGHHKMRILEETVHSFKNAETRYLILAAVSAEKTVVDPLGIVSSSASSALSPKTMRSSTTARTHNKCTIALALRNLPGAIFKLSSCFAFRNLDIHKIESRPATLLMHAPSYSTGDRPFTQRHWDLIFFIDYEPSEDPAVNAALRANLLEYCLWIEELGTYPSGLQALEAEPSAWTNMVELVSL